MRINTGRFLYRRAMLSPRQVGLCAEGREWSYAELNRRANRLAHSMARLGVRPGDRVGMLAQNGVEHFDLFFGLGKMGAILVPINWRLTASELAGIIVDSGIRVLVHDPRYEEVVQEAKKRAPMFEQVRTGAGGGPNQSYADMLSVARDTEPAVSAGDGDEAVIIYAGWSGGRPRGVMLTHANFFWASVTAIATINEPGAVFLLALPFYHIGGLGWLPIFMHLGIRCVLMPSFDAGEFLALIGKEGVTSFGAVPTMLHFLKESPEFARTDFSRLRNVLAYGSAVPVDLIEDYARSGVKIRQLYGLTESTGPALVIDGEHALIKAGSCGLPFFHTRVKLVDDIGMETSPGAIGEVIVSAGHVMKGYWDQPEATTNALRGGWLYTGDLGKQDEDEYFYIVDRKKDMIISGGENVYPAEVESAIVDHPAVMDVAVIGAKDKIWGEMVKAVIVKKKGRDLTEKELTEWLKGKIAPFKIPRIVSFAESMPRTLTGKMEKRRLREGDTL
ncbi:MAG TPA: AMP-binding protein [bacterium]|nr:AMP-binding protein [bacterium]